MPLPGGELLIANHELIGVGSASVLRAEQRARPRRRATHALAIVADPLFLADDQRVAVATRDGARGPFIRLPATRDEAIQLAAMVPNGQAWVALDAAASVEAMRGPEVGSAAIVHVATHSTFDPDDPARNGLVLAQVDAAGRPVADGFLAADEVAQLDLAADLVVLSACHTGVGTTYSGEGISGLTRAFEERGVGQVVSSLWQVDDASTTELMVRFYQAMLRDHLRPEAALRRAQLELAADPRFASPYHWAAFAIHGRPHA
jgi:CHAT domain-containing protein